MEGNKFIAACRALPALLAAALSGSLYMCQSSFAEDIIINPCERWQIKTTGIKVHHIITCISGKLPSPPSLRISALSSSFSSPPLLLSTNFHHVIPLKIPLHPNGELEQHGAFICPPFPLIVYLFISSFSSPNRCHSIIARPSVYLNLITISFKLLSQSKYIIPSRFANVFLRSLVSASAGLHVVKISWTQPRSESWKYDSGLFLIIIKKIFSLIPPENLSN